MTSALATLTDITDRILHLKKTKDAVLLAHNYQLPEVQDIADFVGDSLGLSQQAAQTASQRIVFCGVHFMAETAAILCPGKQVLLPDLEAGCSLADTITAEQLRAWKAKHPGAVVVSYVNTSAEVKAESDYCCTSSNAVKVVMAIPAHREIIFLPDFYLGNYVAEVTGRKLNIWLGECHVHAGMRPAAITALRAARPKAEFLVHPECGCTTSFLYYHSAGDISGETHFVSTEGMLRRAVESPAKEFIVPNSSSCRRATPASKTDATFFRWSGLQKFRKPPCPSRRSGRHSNLLRLEPGKSCEAVGHPALSSLSRSGVEAPREEFFRVVRREEQVPD